MKELEIDDMLQLSYKHVFGSKKIIVKLTSCVRSDGVLYVGNIISTLPELDEVLDRHSNRLVDGSRSITFFSFQALKNFGPLTEKDFIKKYPEYLV